MLTHWLQTHLFSVLHAPFEQSFFDRLGHGCVHNLVQSQDSENITWMWTKKLYGSYSVRTGETEGAQKKKRVVGAISVWCTSHGGVSLGSLGRSERAELPHLHLHWFRERTLCCFHRLCHLFISQGQIYTNTPANLEYLASNWGAKKSSPRGFYSI